MGGDEAQVRIRPTRRPTWWLSGRHTASSVALVLAAFAILPQRLGGDDAVRAVALRQLGDGVMPDTKYSLIQPLVSVPLYRILDALGLGIRAVTTLPLVWLAVWCVVVGRLLRRHRSSEWVHHALVLSVASMLGAYLVGFSAEVFTTLGMSGGIMAGLLCTNRWLALAGWLVFAVAAANTPVMIAAAGVIAVVLALQSHRLRYLLVPVGVVVFVVAEATWVSGSLAFTRYGNDIEHGNVQLLPWGDVAGFEWPLWSGLLALLFSFGRGIAFYVPTLWAGPRHAADAVGRVAIALWLGAGALVPIYATWWAWYGGVSFGPRFLMLAVLPGALAAGAAITEAGPSVIRAVLLVTACVLSLWVAISGAAFGVTAQAFDQCVAGGSFVNEPLCWYTPEYSGLWAPLWADVHLGVRHALFIAAAVLVVAPTVLAAGAPAVSPTVAGLRNGRATLAARPWRF